MKLKDKLTLRQVAGQYVIIPIGKRVLEVQNTVFISSSAAYLWDYMKDDFTEDDLVERILNHYTGVTEKEAREDIVAFLDTLRENHILEQEPEASVPSGGSVWITVRDES